MKLEPVIGFEVHAQVGTATKVFCGCENSVGGPPNTRTCPVCLGMPGALPVLNENVVDKGIAAAIALGATVSSRSGFARKNYFYPDLPKGYQITQFDAPLARGGYLDVDTDHGTVRVGIRQIHIEEDAGKTVHQRGARSSLIDMNRCGVPLIEIVTDPDLTSVDDADRFLVSLRRILVYLGVTAARMHEGELRFDANISTREVGDDALGIKTEIKNLNSFKVARRALSFEFARQSRVLEAGGDIVHETVLWDDGAGRTVPMRSKEIASDYRYFPEPDLVDFTVDAGRLDRVRLSMPELPRDARERLVRQYGLPDYDAGVLTSEPDTLLFYELALRSTLVALGERLDVSDPVHAGAGDPVRLGVRPAPMPEAIGDLGYVAKTVSNWVMVTVGGYLNDRGLSLRELAERIGTSGGGTALVDLSARLAEVVAARIRGELSEPAARSLFAAAMEGDESVADLAEKLGLCDAPDEESLTAVVRSILQEHPSEVERYRGGAAKLLRFFVGQALGKTGGAADPEVLGRLFVRELDEGGEE